MALSNESYDLSFVLKDDDLVQIEWFGIVHSHLLIPEEMLVVYV